jgi:CheY-like chemotaxis protein
MLVKVLVADDNSANTDIFRKRFEQMGLQVIIITDGHKVIDAVTEELPDLVLLELSLPGIDGLNIASALKRKASTKHIPIVGLSSDLSDDDRKIMENVGFNDFVIKPIKIKELIMNMKEWIKEGRRAAS